MSRIIKSQHFVEAHPCRLDPVDVDAFFVNNQEEEESQYTLSGTDAETAATLEEVLETIFPPGENVEAEPDESSGTDSGKNPTNKGARSAFSRSENSEAPEEQDTIANDSEPDGPATRAPEIDMFKNNLEAEKLIDQSKEEAGVLTRLAREKAESITGAANEKASGIMEQAKTEAALIAEKARAQGEEITEQAKTQANEVLNQAKQEAAKIIDEAKLQAGELKAQAQEEGLAAGHKEGLAKARQEIEANLENSITILAQAEEERVKRIASSEAELLRLVAGIAEKIIGSELKSHPEQIVSLVGGALSRVATANSITIKINPGDERLIRENLPSLQEVFSEPKSIGIKADQTIAPGDCFVETEHGKVDARIKSQLERIMNEILKAGQVNEPQ